MLQLLKLSIVGSLAILLNTACATMSDEVSLKKITKSERIYAGRILVELNGQPASRCEIYLGYDITPSIKLSADGFVVYKTDREKFQMRSVACYHKYSPRLSAWHHQKLNLEPVAKSADQSAVQYFGDITLKWQIDPETTKETAEKDTDSRTPMKEGRVDDSGELIVDIVDNSALMQNTFFEKVPAAKEKNMALQSAIVTKVKK